MAGNVPLAKDWSMSCVADLGIICAGIPVDFLPAWLLLCVPIWLCRSCAPCAKRRFLYPAFVSRRLSQPLTVIALVAAPAPSVPLPRLCNPFSVDEFHFGKFVDSYLNGTYFFDIHPPLGKLTLAAGGRLGGYAHVPGFYYDKIGKNYTIDGVRYLPLRMTAATFGVASVPLTYALARTLAMSPTAAVLAATANLCDFLSLIEARLILVDSQLLFYCQAALLSALRLWQTAPGTLARVGWLLTTGVLSGCALSIKHTALATPGLIALVSFFGAHFLPAPLSLIECVVAGACGIGVYAAWFWLHFALLPLSGGKGDRFMNAAFRKALVGSPTYDPKAVKPGFWSSFVYLNRRMVASNAGISKKHTWQTRWYEWMVNVRGVLYFSRKASTMEIEAKALASYAEALGNTTDADPAAVAAAAAAAAKGAADAAAAVANTKTPGGAAAALSTKVYLIGNPVVASMCLATGLGFLVTVALLVRYRRSALRDGSASGRGRLGALYTGIFLLSGWVANLAPYVLVDRPAFLYHYIPSLMYAQLLSAQLVDMLPVAPRRVVVAMAVAAMAAALVFWAPWIYALPLTKEQHLRRQLGSQWT